MTDANLFGTLYARTQDAKFHRRDHVEVTTSEVEQLRDLMPHKALPGTDAVFGFPAKIVDTLTDFGTPTVEG